MSGHILHIWYRPANKMKISQGNLEMNLTRLMRSGASWDSVVSLITGEWGMPCSWSATAIDTALEDARCQGEKEGERRRLPQLRGQGTPQVMSQLSRLGSIEVPATLHHLYNIHNQNMIGIICLTCDHGPWSVRLSIPQPRQAILVSVSWPRGCNYPNH